MFILQTGSFDANDDKREQKENLKRLQRRVVAFNCDPPDVSTNTTI
jgi:hypothetical protein